MKLRTQIDEKYKTAFKLKNTEEVNTLRLIRSSIKDKDIEKRSGGNTDLINDQEIGKVLIDNSYPFALVKYLNNNLYDWLNPRVMLFI